MAHTKEDLKSLLERIFEDAVVSPAERAELNAMRGELPAEDSAQVFKAFLEAKWGEALADYKVSSQERALLGQIIHEFGFEAEDLPLQARIAFKDLL